MNSSDPTSVMTSDMGTSMPSGYGDFGMTPQFSSQQNQLLNGASANGFWSQQNGGILPAENPSTSNACGSGMNSFGPVPSFSENGDSMNSTMFSNPNFEAQQQQFQMRMRQQQQTFIQPNTMNGEFAGRGGMPGGFLDAQTIQNHQQMMMMQQQQQQQQRQNQKNSMFSPQPGSQQQQQSNNSNNGNVINASNHISSSMVAAMGGSPSISSTADFLPSNGASVAGNMNHPNNVDPNFASPGGGAPPSSARMSSMSPVKNGWGAAAPSGPFPPPNQQQQQQSMMMNNGNGYMNGGFNGMTPMQQQQMQFQMEQQRAGRMLNGGMNNAAMMNMMMNGRPVRQMPNALLFNTDMANTAIYDIKEPKKAENMAQWHYMHCQPSTSMAVAGGMMYSQMPNGAMPMMPPMMVGGMPSHLQPPPPSMANGRTSIENEFGVSSPAASVGSATQRGTKRKASSSQAANSTPSPSLLTHSSGGGDVTFSDPANRATPASACVGDGRNSVSSSNNNNNALAFMSSNSDDPLKLIELMTQQRMDESPTSKQIRADNQCITNTAANAKTPNANTTTGHKSGDSKEQKLAALEAIKSTLFVDSASNSSNGSFQPMMPNGCPMNPAQQQQMFAMQMRKQQAFLAAQQQQGQGGMAPFGGGPPMMNSGMPPPNGAVMPPGVGAPPFVGPIDGADGMPSGANPQMMMMMMNGGMPGAEQFNIPINNGQMSMHSQQRLLMQQQQQQRAAMQQQQERIMAAQHQQQQMNPQQQRPPTSTPTSGAPMGDSLGGNGGGMPSMDAAMQQNGMLSMWSGGQHPMPQSLTNLDARVPVQKMQYYAPNGAPGVGTDSQPQS